MFLNELCVSLEIAKKLKSLGVKQNINLFYWAESPHLMHYDVETKEHEIIETRTDLLSVYYRPEEMIEKWAAFTASEIMDLLPHHINRGASLKITKSPNIYFCEYGYGEENTEDKNLANCLGLMLIAILEKDKRND